jgi:flagellar hook-basal body complex protein FliE
MNNTINSNALLMQMRMMAARAEGVNRGGAIAPELLKSGASSTVSGAGKDSFTELLANRISQVNEMQKTSADLATRFEQGDPQVDLAEVMVAMQRSQVGFTAVTQVRNRLVAAYQEIMNMPV